MSAEGERGSGGGQSPLPINGLVAQALREATANIETWRMVETADSVQGGSGSVQGGSDSVQGESVSVQGGSDSVQGESGSVQGGSDSVQGESNSVQGESGSVQNSGKSENDQNWKSATDGTQTDAGAPKEASDGGALSKALVHQCSYPHLSSHKSTSNSARDLHGKPSSFSKDSQNSHRDSHSPHASPPSTPSSPDAAFETGKKTSSLKHHTSFMTRLRRKTLRLAHPTPRQPSPHPSVCTDAELLELRRNRGDRSSSEDQSGSISSEHSCSTCGSGGTSSRSTSTSEHSGSSSGRNFSTSSEHTDNRGSSHSTDYDDLFVAEKTVASGERKSDPVSQYVATEDLRGCPQLTRLRRPIYEIFQIEHWTPSPGQARHEKVESSETLAEGKNHHERAPVLKRSSSLDKPNFFAGTIFRSSSRARCKQDASVQQEGLRRWSSSRMPSVCIYSRRQSISTPDLSRISTSMVPQPISNSESSQDPSPITSNAPSYDPRTEGHEHSDNSTSRRHEHSESADLENEHVESTDWGNEHLDKSTDPGHEVSEHRSFIRLMDRSTSHPTLIHPQNIHKSHAPLRPHSSSPHPPPYRKSSAGGIWGALINPTEVVMRTVHTSGDEDEDILMSLDTLQDLNFLPGRKAINSEVEIQCENGERRVLRSTCDWNEGAINGDHLWCPTSASGDFCYVGEDYCCKSGARMKCSACKIIAHTGCIAALVEKVKFPCKPTFRDVGPRQYREQTATHHHWVHRRNQKGKCKQCGKGFQSKLLFGSKEIVAISCSWCKAAYHNKESCFNISKIEETCSLGIHSSIIVPPSWIVKLPRRGSFKSSLRKSPKKRASTKRKNRDKNDKETRPFAIKPIPNANIKPLIVFINPKSGGNQGAKLMQKFQWLLNPRQVFDLTQGGPKAGLEMFRKVTNLRVLACGGDGTVGWVLSVLDQLNFQPPPAVAVLPLGTGNDLARALGWGGGYTDEPISKILCNIADGEVVHLDRWRVDVVKNEDFEPTEEGRDTLPLSVVNNYFSFGVDAHIALEFHEAREANPQKFNSRLRNKMFYGQAGGKDLLQRKWKDLSDNCTLECDGKDMTPVLKEYKVHAVVFLNIPSYGSGTHPWNRSQGVEQQTDDGIIEVIGLTTYQMPLLQAGGHGTTICQCKRAKIITKKTIPMQVDGEAARVNPSIIELTHLNKASMVTKKKAKSVTIPHLEKLRLQVSCITMFDYEQHHYDKEKLRSASSPLGVIMIDQDADLEQVRKHINQMMEEKAGKGRSRLSDSWCFLDSCTAERFFRIDRAQEHLHYVTDICTEDIFLLDPELTDPTHLGGVRGDVSVDNDIDHSERLAMVSDSDCGGGLMFHPAPPRCPAPLPCPPPLTPGQDSSDTGGEEEGHSLHDRVFGPEYYPPSHLLEKNSDGIIKAAKQGDLKMLKDLHSQGYSLLSIDAQGQTALHYGARHGFKDIVRYLIASAPPSILDMVDNEKGQTALHQAAQNRRRTVCCMLVAAGASLTIKDLQGNTPRALAQRADDQELAAYLESQEQFQTMVHEDLETTV